MNLNHLLRVRLLSFSTLCCFALMVFTSSLIKAETSNKLSDAELDFFEKKIRPVLVQKCYSCHSEKAGKPKAGLMLDSRKGMHSGGDSGPAVVPGDIDSSLIMGAIRYDDFEMPPKEKLPEHVIADFEKWVKMGAPDPRDQVLVASSTSSVEAAKSFWSFQKPITHDIPKSADQSWMNNRIDGFVSAKLKEENLSPAEKASPRTLIRRLSYDLKGLPPTIAEVEKFAADTSPSAYEHLIDEFLASEKFGERWARPWLDIARYAEDQAHVVGGNKSLFYPNAYLYRDWVINALNEDVPYDQFIRLQLAADLMEGNHEDNIAALGFLGLGPKYYRRNDPEVMADEWEDRIDTVGRGLLGLTVACARCHDHKYDPIGTDDYYAIAGVFASTQMFNKPLNNKVELNKDGQAKAPKDSFHIIKDGSPKDINIQIRGNAKDKGAIVPRRFLAVLTEAEPPQFKQGSGRLELANAIVDNNNPLTARVFVNRVWGELIGKPLVSTTSNFGLLGDAPTHQDLLDDLSVRFVESGWSIKWLIKEILMSSTYQQSSIADLAKVEADPSNRWLSRMNRRKLDVEKWRDTILYTSGQMDDSLGGTSIDPQDPKENKRTVYSRISRLELNKMLAMFDFPDPNTHSPKRNQSTTPLQKMFVLNSPFMVHNADHLAKRVLNEAGPNTTEGIHHAYQLLFGREPTDEEIQIALIYLRDRTDTEQKRWQQYAQVLFASNELLFID